MAVQVKAPLILDKVFSDEEFETFKQYLFEKPKPEQAFDPGFGRCCFNDYLINEYAEKLLPLARKVFNSETLLSSYSLFCHYEGMQPSLYKHIDDNACTYTIDMCVYQNEPWDLWVEHDGVDKNYTLSENQALAYYGNDQYHWREAFPNPGKQHVAMIFFHFVEPDHWWYTKGQSYVEVIRKNMTEEEWSRRQS